MLGKAPHFSPHSSNRLRNLISILNTCDKLLYLTKGAPGCRSYDVRSAHGLVTCQVLLFRYQMTCCHLLIILIDHLSLVYILSFGTLSYSNFFSMIPSMAWVKFEPKVSQMVQIRDFLDTFLALWLGLKSDLKLTVVC